MLSPLERQFGQLQQELDARGLLTNREASSPIFVSTLCKIAMAAIRRTGEPFSPDERAGLAMIVVHHVLERRAEGKIRIDTSLNGYVAAAARNRAKDLARGERLLGGDGVRPCDIADGEALGANDPAVYNATDLRIDLAGIDGALVPDAPERDLMRDTANGASHSELARREEVHRSTVGRRIAKWTRTLRRLLGGEECA